MSSPQDIVIRFRENDMHIFNRLEEVRTAKGMTRKGFVMHALANTYPELTEEIVAWLMGRKTVDRKAVLEATNDAN